MLVSVWVPELETNSNEWDAEKRDHIYVNWKGIKCNCWDDGQVPCHHSRLLKILECEKALP